MAYVELPNINLKINETVKGSGTTVIFMPAAYGPGNSWAYPVPVFMEAGHRYLSYDRRDWGRSRPYRLGGRTLPVTPQRHPASSGVLPNREG